MTDLRTLAQAVVDAWRDYGETASLEHQKPALEATWQAAMKAAGMTVRRARAILAAMDAADAQGYARAMGEVVERCQEPAPIRSGSARVRMAHAAGWGNAMCHVADWAIERCE